MRNVIHRTYICDTTHMNNRHTIQNLALYTLKVRDQIVVLDPLFKKWESVDPFVLTPLTPCFRGLWPHTQHDCGH